MSLVNNAHDPLKKHTVDKCKSHSPDGGKKEKKKSIISFQYETFCSYHGVKVRVILLYTKVFMTFFKIRLKHKTDFLTFIKFHFNPLTLRFFILILYVSNLID